MERCTHILCLAAFALFRSHSTSGVHGVDDFFNTESMPQPYNYLNTSPMPDTIQDIGMIAPECASPDEISLDIYLSIGPNIQAPLVVTIQGEDDLPSLNTLVKEYSLLVQHAQTQDVQESQDEVDLSSICAFLDEYPWLAQEAQTGATSLPQDQSAASTVDKHSDEVPRQRLECDMCLKKFSSKVTLKRHRKSKHPNGKRVAPGHRCGHCDEVFNHPLKLYQHKKTMHPSPEPKEEYNCKECGRKCLTQSGLTKHINRLHEVDLMGPNDPRLTKYDHQDKKYTCEQCGLPYATNRTLTKHMKDFHGQQSKRRAAKKDATSAQKSALLHDTLRIL